MISNFLQHYNIPYPPHLCGWDEFEFVRILRFQGDINRNTIPKILEFGDKMYKAGLPVKNIIIDGAKITDIDSATVAAIFVELQKKDRKIGLINVPAELRSYLEIFHQENKLQIYKSEEEALAVLNRAKVNPGYLPAMARTLKKHKALSLLIALVAFIISLPVFEASQLGILYLVFFTFVLLAGIYAISYNMRHVAGGVLLAAPTLITAWSNVFIQDPQILSAQLVFIIIFMIYTIAVILWHILAAKKITINELYGAICVYIMVGMAFGVTYALLYALDPSALSFPPEEKAPSMTGFFYFSFVSMSSTGFSGFTAVSGMARAVVIIQVIIGIMYMSCLIGKLVSANTPDDDGLFDNMGAKEAKIKTDFWSEELAINFFRQKPLLLILAMAMLNYAGSVLMTVLKWPFFLDSWGTSLAVILGGLWAGVWAGVIYNLVMALTFWGKSAWAWMFCSILIAVLTWLFFRRGWVDLHKPGKLLAAGVVSGFLNAGLVAFIMYVTQLPTYAGMKAVYNFFVELTGNADFAALMEKAAVETTDKTIALLLAAVTALFIRDILSWRKLQAGWKENLKIDSGSV